MTRRLWPALLLTIVTARQQITRQIDVHGLRLDLYENTAIRSPYYDECEFFRGRVHGKEPSSATVAECAGDLYGVIQIQEEVFVLQPDHVLRRRDVMLSEPPTTYDLNDDTVTDLELDEDDDTHPLTPHVHIRHVDRSATEYFQDVLPITRSSSGENGLWLELAIVADHTMVKFHGRERLEHYILALMNLVSAIFNDPSLNSNMTLVINKLFLYEEKDMILKYGNAKKSLEAVNKWNQKRLNKLPPGSAGWDAAIWLTRAHIGGPSGFAPVGGVCSKNRAAAIDRDEGLTSAFVIAHELGHLLGLTHDGRGSCDADGVRGSVMAPTVLATLHKYAWSSCSKKQFHELSNKWWCLQQRSQDKGLELGGMKQLTNYAFTMDEQCRNEFGEGFSVCKSEQVRCSWLWCAHRSTPHVCQSKRSPPLKGTPCGINRWCIDKVCKPIPGQVANVKDHSAEWGDWGAWSECSARCGYGIRTSHRHCRYTGSSRTENVCEGAGSQVATCWAGSKCSTTRDVRAALCSRQSHRLIPFLHANETKSCESWCVDYEGGEAISFGSLPDGTSCSYERPYDVCYQGTCVKGQCNSSDPVCNWCPDGFCSINTYVYSQQTNQGWTRLAVIPHEARHLSVQITSPVSLDIALREQRRYKQVVELKNHNSKKFEDIQHDNEYLKYDANIPQNLRIVQVDNNVIDIKEEKHFGWEGKMVVSGAVVHWKQTETHVSITSKSRLLSGLMIMGKPEHLTEEAITVGVSVNYSTPTERKSYENRWALEKDSCSVSCGGGVRLVRPKCVHRHNCPSPRYEYCNTHSCEYAWVGGEWEECSATCGNEGIQERQIFCLPANISSNSLSRRELIRFNVSPALCPTAKLDKHQACNRIPCPVYWQHLPWTPCSATCGRGISRRPLHCPAPDPMFCGPKPREHTRKCRIRRCPKPKVCPEKDSTQYCELFTPEQLNGYCGIPAFKQYCCNACQNAKDIERGVG